MIQQIIEQLSADGVKRGKDWKDYQVYVPIYKVNSCVGLPLVILVSPSETRLSTAEEALEYLDFENNN